LAATHYHFKVSMHISNMKNYFKFYWNNFDAFISWLANLICIILILAPCFNSLVFILSFNPFFYTYKSREFY
jgi:hypothetical protein